MVTNVLTIVIMFPLHQHRDVKEMWPWYRNMEEIGAVKVISDFCHFIRREVTHIAGLFFDHDGPMSKHPKFTNFERHHM